MKTHILGIALSLSILLSPVPAYAAGLTSAQVQSILGLLSAFGADSTTIANVSTILGGSPIVTTVPRCYMIFRDLGGVGTGSYGAQVGQLQRALQDEGFTISDRETGNVPSSIGES